MLSSQKRADRLFSSVARLEVAVVITINKAVPGDRIVENFTVSTLTEKFIDETRDPVLN